MPFALRGTAAEKTIQVYYVGAHLLVAQVNRVLQSCQLLIPDSASPSIASGPTLFSLSIILHPLHRILLFFFFFPTCSLQSRAMVL